MNATTFEIIGRKRNDPVGFDRQRVHAGPDGNRLAVHRHIRPGCGRYDVRRDLPGRAPGQDAGRDARAVRPLPAAARLGGRTVPGAAPGQNSGWR